MMLLLSLSNERAASWPMRFESVPMVFIRVFLVLFCVVHIPTQQAHIQKGRELQEMKGRCSLHFSVFHIDIILSVE